MMQYIGLDLHAKSFSIAVLDEHDVTVPCVTQPTSGEALVRVVTAFSKPRVVALEESTLADWAFRILSPHAQVIVSNPRENHWIAKDEKIDDESAACKLALLLRMGMLKPVYHSDSLERQAFKELVQAYHDSSKQITRYKNKIKARFGRRNIPCRGSNVFSPERREEWRAKLPTEGARVQVDLLWEILDHLRVQQETLKGKLTRLAKQFPQIARFRELPGVGLIRAATFFAFIDTPQRFRTHGKLWVYCGIGIVRASSGQSCGPEHLTRCGNRTLKATLKGAALSAVTAGENPFADKYHRQVAEGMAPELALLSVARSIASTLWAMWRKDEHYQPSRPARAR